MYDEGNGERLFRAESSNFRKYHFPVTDMYRVISESIISKSEVSATDSLHGERKMLPPTVQEILLRAWREKGNNPQLGEI